MLAQKLGKRIFIVVEKLNEIDVIARTAKRLKVMPNIGIRIKHPAQFSPCYCSEKTRRSGRRF